MDLSIVILNYNVKEFVSNLLLSLREATARLKAEIFVVDNASEDGSVELITARFPEVTLIESTENIGFSRGNNLALPRAAGRYILFLNPDTLVPPDTLVRMVEFMDAHPEIGLSSCKLLNADGTLQLACRRGFPGPWTSFCKVTGLSSIFPKSRLFAKYNLTYLDENETYEVDAICGAFMMMRKSVYDITGGLDEQFFMYGEDLDLCYRVQKAGFKVYYVHDCAITHYKGESTRRSSIDETRVFYDAMRLFVRKHLASSYLVEFLLMVAISMRESVAFLGRWRLMILPVIADLFFFNFSLFIAETLYSTFSTWRGFPDDAPAIVYSVPVLLTLFAGFLAGVYQKDRILVLRPVTALLSSFIFLSSVTYFFRDFAYSRAVLILTYFFSGVFFILWRSVVKIIFKAGNVWVGRASYKTLIIGSGDEAARIARLLRDNMMYRYRVVGFVSKEKKDTGKVKDGLEIVGSVETLSKMIREEKIREVIFSADELSINEIFRMSSELHKENAGIKIAGRNIDFLLGRKEVTLVDDITLIDFSLNMAAPAYRTAKRMFDIFASFSLIMFLSPLYFMSRRFREKAQSARLFSALPKVIFGSMSLVGVAPGGETPLYPLKRGMTGYWFTENEKSENFGKLDIFYAKNQNIWLDVEILSRTLLIIFAGR